MRNCACFTSKKLIQRPKAKCRIAFNTGLFDMIRDAIQENRNKFTEAH